MSWCNYHTHSDYCDGKGDLREFAQAAQDAGMQALGFSSHCPLPFPCSCAMKMERLPHYCAEITSIKTIFNGRIKIHCGLEVDYIPDIIGPHDSYFKSYPLDYIIGSVHFVGTEPDGTHWPIDSSLAEFKHGLASIYNGDIRAAVEDYYRCVTEMVRTQPPDIVGHLDLIKKNNTGGKFFREDEVWYYEAVMRALEAIAASPCVMEVNTGGIARKRTDSLYPSPWILREAFALDIPITLNSDAHQPNHLTSEFRNAAKRLLEIGYRELMILDDDGKWKPRGFSEKGLV